MRTDSSYRIQNDGLLAGRAAMRVDRCGYTRVVIWLSLRSLVSSIVSRLRSSVRCAERSLTVAARIRAARVSKRVLAKRTYSDGLDTRHLGDARRASMD